MAAGSGASVGPVIRLTSRMFKQRLITALLLVVLAPLAVWTLSRPALGVALLLIVAVASDEWGQLNGLTGRDRLVYTGVIVLLSVSTLSLPVWPLLAIGVVSWVWLLLELLNAHQRLDRGLFGRHWLRMTTGALILVPAWRALVAIGSAPDGRRRLLLLGALVATADIAAYAAGRCFGRHRLAPHVSPGKTTEGVAGGVLGVAVLGYATGVGWFGLTGRSLLVWVSAACLLALATVVGDLTESRAKRIAGVKDSGSLLPGHGGILDRIDGFTAAAPIYALAWLWLGHY